MIAAGWLFLAPNAQAVTNIFFNAAQTMTVVASNANAVTMVSGDYEFTYSVDGYWAACAGCPVTGRFFSVFWPNGIQAQAITAGPLYRKGANITLKRSDGKRFDLRAFTRKLLAYTAGTGAAFEVMPQIDGEDALPDPLMFDASGSGGVSFPHTPNLVDYDTYKFHLFVDWALTALTLVDTNATSLPPLLSIVLVAPGTLMFAWPTNSSGFTLQRADALSPANWLDVTNAIDIVEMNNAVTLSPETGSSFFRLRRP